MNTFEWISAVAHNSPRGTIPRGFVVCTGMCYLRAMLNSEPTPAVESAYRSLLAAIFPLETAQREQRPDLRIVPND